MKLVLLIALVALLGLALHRCSRRGGWGKGKGGWGKGKGKGKGKGGRWGNGKREWSRR